MKEIEIEPGVKGLELTEGKAVVHLEKDQGVFYNPVQCFNRDIRWGGQSPRILFAVYLTWDFIFAS